MTQMVSAGLLALPRRPHVLYRFFDRADTLLYVGITMDLPKRIGDHRKGKPWWSAVDHITVEHFDSREAVLAAETEAIKTESPLYNVSQNELVQAPSLPPTALLSTEEKLAYLSPRDRDHIAVPAYTEGMHDLATSIVGHFDEGYEGDEICPAYESGWMTDVRRKLALHPPGEEGSDDEVVNQAIAFVELAIDHVAMMEYALESVLDAFHAPQRAAFFEAARREVAEHLGDDHSYTDLRCSAAHFARRHLESLFGTSFAPPAEA